MTARELIDKLERLLIEQCVDDLEVVLFDNYIGDERTIAKIRVDILEQIEIQLSENV